MPAAVAFLAILALFTAVGFMIYIYIKLVLIPAHARAEARKRAEWEAYYAAMNGGNFPPPGVYPSNYPMGAYGGEGYAPVKKKNHLVLFIILGAIVLIIGGAVLYMWLQWKTVEPWLRETLPWLPIWGETQMYEDPGSTPEEPTEDVNANTTEAPTEPPARDYTEEVRTMAVGLALAGADDTTFTVTEADPLDISGKSYRQFNLANDANQDTIPDEIGIVIYDEAEDAYYFADPALQTGVPEDDYRRINTDAGGNMSTGDTLAVEIAAAAEAMAQDAPAPAE
ncbi:hypothetical protein FACS1894219_10420 [Clostridia bacterium]|nr:hypothetical protein FACS1894219_10420 [Clostridia bacterium]